MRLLIFKRRFAQLDTAAAGGAERNVRRRGRHPDWVVLQVLVALGRGLALLVLQLAVRWRRGRRLGGQDDSCVGSGAAWVEDELREACSIVRLVKVQCARYRRLGPDLWGRPSTLVTLVTALLLLLLLLLAVAATSATTFLV